jgi:hypothetical protein
MDASQAARAGVTPPCYWLHERLYPISPFIDDELGEIGR